jgi:NitT/TauT family transport system permease protein
MTSRRLSELLPPLAFGLAVLALWEAGVRLMHVPAIILPPPSAIATRFATSIPTLAADFKQTIQACWRATSLARSSVSSSRF